EAEARVDRDLSEMEAALAGRAWLAGERYSLADVLWTPILARLSLIGQGARLRSASRPNVARDFEALRARPSYRSADVWDRITPARAARLAWRATFGRPRREAPR